MTAHDVAHKLNKIYADLHLAEQEICGLMACDRKDRALAFVRQSKAEIDNFVNHHLMKEISNAN